MLLAATSATMLLPREGGPRAAAVIATLAVASPRRSAHLGGSPGGRARRAATHRAAGGLDAAATDVLGRPAGLATAGLMVAIGVIICLRAPRRTDASLALWSLRSLVAAPYAWSYDLLFLGAGAVGCRGCRCAA